MAPEHAPGMRARNALRGRLVVAEVGGAEQSVWILEPLRPTHGCGEGGRAVKTPAAFAPLSAWCGLFQVLGRGRVLRNSARDLDFRACRRAIRSG
jgi:hypothetical protein